MLPRKHVTEQGGLPRRDTKSNPHFGKMYASLVAYRNESLAWMQVAELSFDSFMMRMRTRT
jgi:TRAP-type mannitol/chloroaromatic compound transport system substrate-binding protein